MEIDEFEAAAKRHKMKEEARIEKKKMKQIIKTGELIYKDE